VKVIHSVDDGNCTLGGGVNTVLGQKNVTVARKKSRGGILFFSQNPKKCMILTK
jgi:hypothetical protein